MLERKEKDGMFMEMKFKKKCSKCGCPLDREIWLLGKQVCEICWADRKPYRVSPNEFWKKWIKQSEETPKK